MPITFEAPQPFAPGVNFAAGAAQAEQQNTPLLAQLYAEAGRNRQAAATAEADRFAQNARVGAGLGEQAQEHADTLQFQKDAFAASRQASQRDVFHAQVAEAQAAQHAQLTAWAHAQDMTFQDNMALEREQNAVSDVMQAYRQGQLTDKERDDYLLKLKTGIDPARQRQENAQAKMMQSHAQAYEEQAKRQTAIANFNTQTATQSLPQRTNVIYDPQAMLRIQDAHPDWTTEQAQKEAVRQGAYSQWVSSGLDQYGELKGHFIDGHGRQTKAVPGETTGAGGLTAEAYLKHYDRALEQVDKLIETNDKLRQPGANGQPAAGGDPDITWANRQKLLAERLQGMGLAPNLQAHLAGGKGGSGQAGQPGTPQADFKPFDSPEQASTVQKAQLDTWKQQAAGVQKLPIPDVAKKDYGAAVGMLQALLQDYGSVASPDQMSDTDKVLWQWAVDKKKQVESLPFRGPQAAPPGRTTGDRVERTLEREIGGPVQDFFTPRMARGLVR